MCRWCEPSLIADRLTAGLALPARREFGSDAATRTGGGGPVSNVPVVFRNGIIRTMAGPDPAEALAVSGERILAVGSVAEVRSGRLPKCRPGPGVAQGWSTSPGEPCCRV